MQQHIKLLAIMVSLLILTSFVSSVAETGQPRKCIMVFGAHADDLELMAGGTFAKYIMGEGYEGIYVMVINNTCGCLIERAPGGRGAPMFTVSRSPKTYPVGGLETIQIRTEETLQAAEVFGANPVFLNFHETWV